MRPSSSTGPSRPILKKEEFKARILPHLIGKMSQSLSLGEMMLNANTNGIKDISLVLQRLNGRKKRMMNYS